MATWLLRTSVAVITFYSMIPVNRAMAQEVESQPAAAGPTAPQTGLAQPVTSETSAQSGHAQPAPPAAAASTAFAPPASVAAEPAKTEDELPVLFPAASRVRLSGYGHIDGGYTRVAGKDAALACAGGALLINRAFAIGLMGCGVPTRISARGYGNVTHESGDRLELGYGGIVAGYHFFPNKLYNVALSAMIGGGAAQISNRTWVSDSTDDDDDEHVKTTDPIFVAESRLTGFVNVTRWARAGVFVGYRLAGGVDMRNLSSEDLSGPVAGGTLQFGWF